MERWGIILFQKMEVKMKEPIAYLTEDSLSADDFTITYHLPEGDNLMSDNEMGKTYYSEQDETHVTTSIDSLSWLTAKDMVDNKNQAGISKIFTEGEYEINGINIVKKQGKMRVATGGCCSCNCL